MKYTLSLLFIIPIILQGQHMIPKVNTPTASSFLQYTEIPVNTFSGTPDISVPLFNVNDGIAQLPFLLRNHATGIKVEEQASWVGLGWNLNVGGVVTQTIVGKNDRYGGVVEYRPEDYLPDFGDLPPATWGLEYFGRVYDKESHSFETYLNGRDGHFAPDLFSFNFAGYSGHFIIDQNDRSIRQIEKNSNLKISIYPDGGDYYNSSTGWKIIDPEGVIYLFRALETVDYSTDATVPVLQNYYLTEIIYTDGTEVKYEYVTGSAVAYQLPNYAELMYHMEYDINRPNHSFTDPLNEFTVLERKESADRSRYLPKVLSKITTPNVVVDFYRSSRLDFNNEFKLDRIEIKEKLDPANLRNINFYYSYFESSSIGTSLYTGYTADELSKRLKLDSVSVGPGETYSFQYYDNYQLPKKSSAARDHWGYSNGKNNTGLIPNLGFFLSSELQRMSGNYTVPGTLKHKRSNDRGASAEYMVSATLRKINYPTGGFSEFTFEPHTFSNFKIPYAGYYQTIESYNVDATRFGNVTSPGTPTMLIPDANPSSPTVTLNLLVNGYKGYVSTNPGPPTQADVKAARFNSLKNTIISLVKYNKVTGNYIGVEQSWAFPDNLFYYGYDEIPGFEELKIETTVTVSRDYKYGLSVGMSYAYPTTDSYSSTLHVDANLSLTVFKPFDEAKSIGGGLRIKTIENNSGELSASAPIIQEFQYDTDSVSSGKLLQPPNYLERRRMNGPFGGCYFPPDMVPKVIFIDIEIDEQAGTSRVILNSGCPGDYNLDGYHDETGRPCELGTACYVSCFTVGFDFWMLTGTSNIMLPFSVRGGSVNYSTVTVFNGSKASHDGYTINTFKNEEHSFVYKRVPTIPKLQNGLLEKKEMFNKSGERVYQEEHTYEVADATPYWGIHVYDDYVGATNLNCTSLIRMDDFDNRFAVLYYNVKSEQWRRKSSVITHYNSTSGITSELLSYNSIGQAVEVKRYTGNFSIPPFQELDRQVMEFPYDLKAVNTTAQNMVNANFLTPQFKIRKYRGAFQTGLTETDFLQETIIITSGSRVNFYPSVIREYDRNMTTFRQTDLKFEKGKLTEIMTPDGIRQAFIWDFPKSQLLVHGKNIDYIALKNKFNTCAGDELCLVGSVGPLTQLVMYRHKVLMGATRSTDMNGLKTSYQYDSQGRLKIVSDHHDNLIQYFSYHFVKK
jgi:hypothetical protein